MVYQPWFEVSISDFIALGLTRQYLSGTFLISPTGQSHKWSDDFLLSENFLHKKLRKIKHGEMQGVFFCYKT